MQVHPSTGVVVPLRSFTFGNTRLAETLDDGARTELGRRMAEQVVAAASAFRTAIVSSALEVVAWAAEHEIACLDDPGSLDLAAEHGRTWAADVGLTRVAIVHADLPHITSLSLHSVIDDGPVAVVVPDQRDDGTPVLSLPVGAPFRFAYGPHSFRRHIDEATRIGLTVRVVRDAALGFDVDLPEDLARLELPTP